MRALLLKDTHLFEMIDIPIPEPGDGEVRVRVLTTLICGSEVHGYHGKHWGRKAPAVMGHEVCGVVDALGPGTERYAKTLRPGTRVAVMPQQTCGQCEWCLSGSGNLCKQRLMLGFTNWPGSFAEYFVIPARLLFPVANAVPPAVGALMEPLSVATHAVRRAGVKEGDSVLVFGSGGIGLSVMLCAKNQGAETIVACDLYDYNLDAAKSLAATHVCNAGRSGESVVALVDRLTRGRGVDHVFLAADGPGILDQAVRACAIRGVIVVIAMYDKPVPVALQALKTKEQHLVGSVTFDETDFAAAVAVAEKNSVSLATLVTHTFPLERADEAFALVDRRLEDQIRVAFEVARD